MRTWFDLTDDDERAIAAFMARVAALPVHAPLRDPRQLWWKGQLVRRWEAERRAQQPLEVMERVEIIGGLVAACGLLVWALPAVVRIVAEPFRQLLG